MSKYMLTLGAVLMALTALVSWGMPATAAAPGGSAANVAQVDLVDEWLCPGSPASDPIFTDLPTLALSLTTQGGPLLVMLTLNHTLPSEAPVRLTLEPVIDGQPLAGDRLQWSVFDTPDVLAFSRVYQRPAGTHEVHKACGARS